MGRTRGTARRSCSLVLALVTIDRSLTEYAIDNAGPDVKAKDIDKALEQLSKGDAEAAGGKFENAIEHYKHAWEKVTK